MQADVDAHASQKGKRHKKAESNEIVSHFVQDKESSAVSQMSPSTRRRALKRNSKFSLESAVKTGAVEGHEVLSTSKSAKHKQITSSNNNAKSSTKAQSKRHVTEQTKKSMKSIASAKIENAKTAEELAHESVPSAGKESKRTHRSQSTEELASIIPLPLNSSDKEVEPEPREKELEEVEEKAKKAGEKAKDLLQGPSTHDMASQPPWLCEMIKEFASLLMDAQATVRDRARDALDRKDIIRAAREVHRALYWFRREARRRITGIVCDLLEFLISITGDPLQGIHTNAGSPNVVVRTSMKKALRTGTRGNGRLVWLFWMIDASNTAAALLKEGFKNVWDEAGKEKDKEEEEDWELEASAEDADASSSSPQRFTSLLLRDCAALALKRYRAQTSNPVSSDEGADRPRWKKEEPWFKACDAIVEEDICSSTNEHKKIEYEWLIWKGLLAIRNLGPVAEVRTPPASPRDLSPRQRRPQYDPRRPHLHECIIHGILRIIVVAKTLDIQVRTLDFVSFCFTTSWTDGSTDVLVAINII